LSAVECALRADFSFDAREFGQPVTLSEVYAAIHRVPGVVAADINKLYRRGQSLSSQQPQPKARLLAALPVVQPDGRVAAAELLTLDRGPIDLEVMS
jgi:hypothetical protein